jgi:2,5-dihydroxypyridine 5,6-dioxygenase
MDDFTVMQSNARKIINECCNVQENEKVLIITDANQPTSIYQALMSAVSERGGIPVVAIMNPAKPGGDLPEIVNAALQSANVIITPTSTSIYHSEGIRNACIGPTQARLLSLSECEERTLIDGGINADFTNLSYVVDHVAELFTLGKDIKFSTPAGTNITAKIENRKAYANTGLSHKPGQMQGIPTIEVFIAPIENSVEGKIVIDASCSGGIGLIEDKPIELIVEKGKVTSVSGGKEAKKLEKMLQESNSTDSYQVAELAVGLNPHCRLTGKIVEDEGKYGTCHMALGNNKGFGGESNAPIHIDMVQQCPTVIIDSVEIIKNGKLKIDVDLKKYGLE